MLILRHVDAGDWTHVSSEMVPTEIRAANDVSWEASVGETVTIISDPTQLKTRFKQVCAATGGVYQNWQVRVHRSLSWYKRASEFPVEHPEARFLYLWIAFNSLYSRWDSSTNAPGHDREARGDFLRTLVACDAQDITGTLLKQHRPLLKKLLGNAYLSPVFWRDPYDSRSRGKATEDANYLEKNYRDRNHAKLLEQAFDRLYVLRGQIVHGASSGGSSLNRTALRHCLTTIEQFLPGILHLVIEHGAHERWPELCYPPVNAGARRPVTD